MKKCKNAMPLTPDADPDAGMLSDHQYLLLNALFPS
jgi:hypothetical protein